MVMWEVQYVKKQGFWFSLQFTQCKRKKLLTTCQHWKHNITCLSDWPICRCHSQLRQSSCPNWSCDQFSQSCSASGKIAPGVYILPHKAMTGVHILPHQIIVTCEIIFFVYMAGKYSLQCLSAVVWKCLAEGKIALGVVWGKIDTAWVIQKYRYRQSKLKNIGIGPKKTYQSSSKAHLHAS